LTFPLYPNDKNFLPQGKAAKTAAKLKSKYKIQNFIKNAQSDRQTNGIDMVTGEINRQRKGK